MTILLYLAIKVTLHQPWQGNKTSQRTQNISRSISDLSPAKAETPLRNISRSASEMAISMQNMTIFVNMF
jgi:hypothetical protein